MLLLLKVRVWEISKLTNMEIPNPEKEFRRVNFEGYVATLCTRNSEVSFFWSGFAIFLVTIILIRLDLGRRRAAGGVDQGHVEERAHSARPSLRHHCNGIFFSTLSLLIIVPSSS